MKPSTQWTLIVAMIVISGHSVRSTNGAPAKMQGVKLGIRTLLKIEQDYIAPLIGDEAPLKKEMKVDLYLQSGKKVDGVEITELQLGKPKNSFKFLSCNLAKGGKQKMAANTLLHIVAEDRVFDVVQDPSTKAFVLLDLARRDELAKARLAKTGYMLWDEPSREVREKTIEEAKKLFMKARELFPNREFLMLETEFYLFFTDMPAEQVAGYVANLDAMYRQLCLAFGILPDKNIWKGKCPILAFLDADMFHQFEATVMNNPNSKGAHGLHHGSNDGGKARALELCLTGKQITAQQGLGYGLVHEIVPQARVISAARELAQQLLKQPAEALRLTKQLLHADEGTQSKQAYLADTAAYIRCLGQSDAQEGIAAFNEKRPPNFG